MKQKQAPQDDKLLTTELPLVMTTSRWITLGVLPSALRAVLRTFKFDPVEFVQLKTCRNADKKPGSLTFVRDDNLEKTDSSG